MYISGHATNMNLDRFIPKKHMKRALQILKFLHNHKMQWQFADVSYISPGTMANTILIPQGETKINSTSPASEDRNALTWVVKGKDDV